MGEGLICNVFVVRTPLQYFNAIEARDRFHQGERNLLLVCAGTRRDAALMARLDDGCWSAVEWLSYRGPLRGCYAWRLRSWLGSLPVISTLYIGLVRHAPLHILNVIKPRALRILDDGNETLLIARWIRRLQEQTWRPRWRDRLLGRQLDPARLQQAVFFTAYDVSTHGFESLRNDYRMFRARSRELPERPYLLFIGSNLLGHCLRDIDVLLDVLNKTRESHPGYEYLYCPHRYESDKVFAQIQDAGYRLFHPGTILEVALAEVGWRPALLASIRSTAVDTLGTLYGIKGVLIEVDRRGLASDMAYAELQGVWHAFRAAGGTTLTLSGDAGHHPPDRHTGKAF